MEFDNQKRRKITLPGRGSISSNFGEGLERVRRGLGQAADIPVPGPAPPRQKLSTGARLGRGLHKKITAPETGPVALGLQGVKELGKAAAFGAGQLGQGINKVQGGIEDFASEAVGIRRPPQGTPPAAQTNIPSQIPPKQSSLDQAEFGSFEKAGDQPNIGLPIDPSKAVSTREAQLALTNEPQRLNKANIVTNPGGSETLNVTQPNGGFGQLTTQQGFGNRFSKRAPGQFQPTFSVIDNSGARAAQADSAAAGQQGLGQGQFTPDARINDRLKQANRMLRKLPFGRPGDFKKRQSLIQAAAAINQQAGILQGGENVRLQGQNAVNTKAAKGSGALGFNDLLNAKKFDFQKTKAQADLARTDRDFGATQAQRKEQGQRNDRQFKAGQTAAVTKQIDTDVESLGPDVGDATKAKLKNIAKQSNLQSPAEVNQMIQGLLTLLELNPDLSNIGQFQAEPAENFFGSPALGLRNRSTGDLDTTTVEKGFFNEGIRGESGGLQNALEAQRLFDRELERRRGAGGG